MLCSNQINVEFIEGLPIDQVADEVSKLTNPHIVVWYIGCNGLRRLGADFYKHYLFAPILKRNSHPTFWLTDLTAWNAFKKPSSSISKSSRCSDVIEQFFDARFKCIRSSKIFKKMQEITDRDFIDYFRKALRRKFISEGSKDYPYRHISVGKVFSNLCPIMTDWFDHDINQTYSIFQYLEGCLIVDEIFAYIVGENPTADLELVFALPNNESKYYKDDEFSFQNDIVFLINKRCISQKLKQVNLKIKFFTFTYSFNPDHRPYNTIGKVIKSNHLSYDDLVDSITNKQSEENENRKQTSQHH